MTTEALPLPDTPLWDGFMAGLEARGCSTWTPAPPTRPGPGGLVRPDRAPTYVSDCGDGTEVRIDPPPSNAVSYLPFFNSWRTVYNQRREKVGQCKVYMGMGPTQPRLTGPQVNVHGEVYGAVRGLKGVLRTAYTADADGADPRDANAESGRAAADFTFGLLDRCARAVLARREAHPRWPPKRRTQRDVSPPPARWVRLVTEW